MPIAADAPAASAGATPAATPMTVRAYALSSRWAWGIALVLILSHAVLAWQSRTPGVTHSNDDALYMLLGRQLEHLSYREEFRVGAPMHGQYPPAWPAMIAVSGVVSGDREAAAFALATLLSTLGLVAFFATARRLLPVGLALGVLAGAALNPSLVSYGGRVMSEAAFWFWTSMTVWALIRGREDRRYLVLAGITAIIAAFTRSIGITLIGAVVVGWAYERRWRSLVGFVVAAALLLGGWGLFTAVNHENVVGRSYVADAAAELQHIDSGAGGVLPLPMRIAGRVREQVMGTLPAMLPLIRVSGTAIDNIVWLVAAVVLGGMGLLALRRRLPELGLYLLFYLGLIAVWPWGPRRFFIPIQPFVLLTMVFGVEALLRQRLPRFASILGFALLGSVLVAAIPGTLKKFEMLRACDRRAPWTDSNCYDDDQRSFFAAVTFARDSLPAEARFLVEREAGFAYHTHRIVQHDQVALGMPDSTFRAYLAGNHIDYVVVTRLTNVELQVLAPKLLANCTYFELIRRFPPYGRLYQLHPAPLPPSQRACSDLGYYVISTPHRQEVR